MSGEMQPALQPIDYERAVVALMRDMTPERKAQVYDFVRFVKLQTTPTSQPLALYGEPLGEEGALMLASIESLRSYWDTPEEDEAWAHFQKAM